MTKLKNESGRSMVEMLGVLAIIGVLSVVGIAGYTTALNKHKANQILNGASIRAIVVSTQIQRGSAAPTLGEFTEADNAVGGATFTGLAAWNKDTDKRFSLTLTGVSTEICTQMKASVGQNSIIREINEGCTTITYNNDLSPNDPKPSGPTGNECTDTCSGGAKCVNGYCECPSGQIWTPSGNSGNGSCVEITEGNCTTNADCEKGEYCKIEGKYDDEAACSVLTTSTCTTLDNGPEITYNGKTFLRSPSYTWWAARNWCLAHGKSLVSLSDLGITGGYNNENAYCKGSACTGADWDALKDAFGSFYYWTNDSKNSCSAFDVNPGLQTVDITLCGRDHFALCR